MLRASLGAFRALLKPRATSLPSSRTGASQISSRTVSRSIAPGVYNTRLLARSFGQLQGFRQTFQPSSKSFTRSGQSSSPFRTSQRTFHSPRARRSQATPKEPPPPAAESQSLSGRLRKLGREYGWSAAGVYFGLTVLDFPFCFLLVRWVGTDKIAEAEHVVVSNVAKVIPTRVKEFWYEYKAALKNAEHKEMGDNHISEDVEMVGWGVKEAEEKNKSEASLATQLALAYAIHKSFIFVRVPLTVAITPRVVKRLRSWGWQVGKRRAKPQL